MKTSSPLSTKISTNLSPKIKSRSWSKKYSESKTITITCTNFSAKKNTRTSNTEHKQSWEKQRLKPNKTVPNKNQAYKKTPSTKSTRLSTIITIQTKEICFLPLNTASTKKEVSMAKSPSSRKSKEEKSSNRCINASDTMLRLNRLKRNQ